jgi:hypothetical protein
MDALSKTTDGLSKVLRRSVLGLDAELAPAFRGIEESATRAKKALADLRAEASKEKYELAPGYSVNLSKLRESGGFYYGKGLEQTVAAQDALRKYREELAAGSEYGLMAAVNQGGGDVPNLVRRASALRARGGSVNQGERQDGAVARAHLEGVAEARAAVHAVRHPDHHFARHSAGAA